jgi:hypothetical protein
MHIFVSSSIERLLTHNGVQGSQIMKWWTDVLNIQTTTRSSSRLMDQVGGLG